MSAFSEQWFIAYYVALGSLLIAYGLYIIFKKHQVAEKLAEVAEYDQPPSAFKSVLKYFLLFTIPGLILSFFPLSWVELIFSLWCLLIVFILGQLLIQWKSVAAQILQMRDVLHKKVQLAGFNFLSIGIVLYMLCYVLITT